MTICLNPLELRAIIEGNRVYKKCSVCQGKGFVFTDVHGNIVLNSEVSESCENCYGIGYVVQIYENSKKEI